MANVIVNDLGIYDVEYLKRKTNGPYLVGKDSRYIRGKDGETVLWDPTSKGPKSWKDPTLADVALEGEFEVDGQKCRTVFSIVREHLKQYVPEWGEKVSSVPAKTLKRIATEYAQAACVGSTIEIGGMTFPYRPVACCVFEGARDIPMGFTTTSPRTF